MPELGKTKLTQTQPYVEISKNEFKLWITTYEMWQFSLI